MNEGKSQVDLKTRTREFALRIIRLYSSLPKTTEAQVMGKQILRSGTSVGVHSVSYTHLTLPTTPYV